jgi:hypothetical protein
MHIYIQYIISKATQAELGTPYRLLSLSQKEYHIGFRAGQSF